MKRQQIRAELADVVIYVLLLANDLKIDLRSAVKTKTASNRHRFEEGQSGYLSMGEVSRARDTKLNREVAIYAERPPHVVSPKALYQHQIHADRRRTSHEHGAAR